MRRRGLLAAAALAAVPRPSLAAELDVAIIGAGVAGLAAAHALIAARKSVVLVEARQRLGGRAFTDTSLGFPFDAGAQWLEDGPLVQALGGRAISVMPSGALIANGKELSKDDYQRLAKITADYEKKIAQIARELPGVSPWQVLAPREPIEKLALAELMRKRPFDGELMMPEGLGTAVARWGAKLPAKLGTRVLRLDSTGRLVKIVSPQGELEARSVSGTVPPPVLESLGFAPPLSAAKRSAIATLSMAAYDKVAVAFTRRVFEAPPDSRVLAIIRGDKFVEALLRPQGREAAIVLLENEEALQLEKGGPTAASATALSLLAEVFGKELRAAFAGARSTAWSRDRDAGGAWPVGPASARAVLAAPHQGRIFFAGDATGDGKLAGAYASGLRAAAEVRNA